jgi:transposase
MSTIAVAGVDVGRDWLDVAIAPSGRGFRVPNGASGIRLVVERLKLAGVARVVLESVGCYARRLIRTLAEAGFEVGVVDPKRIKAFRQAEGKRAKTDKLDRALIARFALAMRDVVRPIPSEEALKIRALSTRRRQLVEIIAMEKTRLKQALDAEIQDSIRALIAALVTERARVERELEARARAQEGAERRRMLLKTAPGVGDVVAMTLLADMPELGALDRGAAAALAGLAPFDDQSGTRIGKAHIAGGRSCVRTALYLSALSAVRCDPAFKAQYQAMRKAGKPAKVALIAIARKLLLALNAMLKEDRPWR